MSTLHLVENKVPQPNGGTVSDVARAVIEGLEAGLYVPGQRMVEADLCLRHGVGRQIVRHALQRLSALGVVELAPNRGARIASMTHEEAVRTLEVTEVLFGLLAESAARRLVDSSARNALIAAIAALNHSREQAALHLFVKARRQFFRALSQLAANPELSRIIDQVRVHVLRAQFGFAALAARHAEELAAVGALVLAGDVAGAGEASRQHVSAIREYLKNNQNRE